MGCGDPRIALLEFCESALTSMRVTLGDRLCGCQESALTRSQSAPAGPRFAIPVELLQGCAHADRRAADYASLMVSFIGAIDAGLFAGALDAKVHVPAFTPLRRGGTN